MKQEKMKLIYTKQQIGFRLRLEQAEGLNRCLKSAPVKKSQQVQDTKNTGKAKEFEPWLKQEYNLFVIIAEAEATLEQLRVKPAIQQHLDELTNNRDTANSPEFKNVEDELEKYYTRIAKTGQKIIQLIAHKGISSRIRRF